MPHDSFANSELACQQTQVLRDVRFEQLQEQPTLKQVASAAAVVCGVGRAHVSVVESDAHCAVGQVGLTDEQAPRRSEFCQEALVEDRILIIEDVAADDAFEAMPFARHLDDIRFYAGLPLLVDNTPVGTLTLLDDRPRELDHVRRAALFGLVHELESHLRVHRRLEESDDPRERLSERLTSMVAHATRLRWCEQQSPATRAILEDLEDEIEGARKQIDRLIDREAAPEAAEDESEEAAFDDEAPTDPNDSSLGYVETEVENDD